MDHQQLMRPRLLQISSVVDDELYLMMVQLQPEDCSAAVLTTAEPNFVYEPSLLLELVIETERQQQQQLLPIDRLIIDVVVVVVAAAVDVEEFG